MLVFSAFFRIIFYNEEIGDPDAVAFTHSFSTFWRTFETLIISILGDNFPDLVNEAYMINSIFPLFIFFYIFFMGIIIFGIFAGGFGGNFMSFYTMCVRKISSDYPEVVPDIEKELELDFFDTEGYQRVKDRMHSREL